MGTYNFDMPEQPAGPDPLIQPVEEPESGDLLSGIGWHAASFVLPCASLTFYRQAVRRKTGSAVLFFMLFMGILSLLMTAGLYNNLSKINTEIRGAFAAGRMPDVTISKGVANIRGSQPAVLIDNATMLVAIDSTGRYTSIDANRYKEGFILTATELVVLSSSGEQRIPLAQINTDFKQDPIVINAETVTNMWQNMSISLTLIALVAFMLWNMGVRLLYVLLLAVVVRGMVAWLHSKQTFGFILTLGIYALVPTLFLVYLLQRLGISFIFLGTIIHLVMWGMACYAALVARGWDLFGPARPLRAWRALLGLPLLVILALDLVFTFPNDGPIDLIATAVIGILMVGVGMFTLPHAADEDEPQGPGVGIS